MEDFNFLKKKKKLKELKSKLTRFLIPNTY